MKTRFFFLFLTAMLLSIGAFAQSNEPLRGDVNGDGEIDIADAVCVVNYIVGNPTPTFVALAADANGDGDIDIADAVTIVNYIVGNPSSLSAQTTYYWYVGQIQPTSLDGLSPINEYTSPVEYTEPLTPSPS